MAYQSLGFEMALVSVDHEANKTVRRFMMTATDPILLAVDIANVINYVEAVTEMTTQGYSITEKFYNDAFAVPADPIVQREVVAVITARDSVVLPKVHTVNIVGAQPDVFYADPVELRTTVDFTNAAVAAYVNMFSPGGECTISDGEYVADDGWLTGKRTTRKNSRG